MLPAAGHILTAIKDQMAIGRLVPRPVGITALVLLCLLLPGLVADADAASPDYQFPITGQVHVQWKCALEEDWPPQQGFVLRRARLKYRHTFFADTRTEIEVGFDDLRLELKDAFLEYRLAAPLRFAAGLRKMPFSREELIPIRRLTVIERTVTNGAFDDRGYLGRDIGLTVEGDLFADRFPVAYALGVYNGNRGRLSRDDNNAKQFAERLEFDPLRWLSLGLNATQRNDSLSGRLVSAWGGDIECRTGSAVIAAEALYGCMALDTGMLGFHILGSWRSGSFEPALRLERFNRAVRAGSDWETGLTAGFNWYLHPLIQIKTNVVTRLSPGRTVLPTMMIQAQAGI